MFSFSRKNLPPTPLGGVASMLLEGGGVLVYLIAILANAICIYPLNTSENDYLKGRFYQYAQILPFDYEL